MAETVIRLTPSARSGLPSGTRLDDQYELEKMIGAGGVGEVYLCRRIDNRGPVAIKMIKADLAGEKAILALFRKEAVALQALNHAAIVGYFGFSTDRRLNRPYLAMEYVDGPSLSDRLKQAPLSPRDTDILRRRIAAGLQAAHDSGIIHRDVSPDNIILPGGDIASAKIIDFGIARTAGLGTGTTVIGDGFAGKYNYASPEQLGLFGGKVDDRSDIYSFGLVLAEALLGKPLDMSGSHADVILKRQKLPDLSGIDEHQLPLLTRMLQPDPKDRIATMSEVAAWTEDGSLAPGTRLDDLYELERMIGSGGVGEVYLGRKIDSGEPVAIKVIKPELAGEKAIFALFRKEAAALQALNHAAIVGYFGFSIDRRLKRPYLAMEYVDGPSLSVRLKTTPLSLEDADALRRRIALGLQAAHDTGIIHRDVSPDNIILAGGSIASAKLIDFGIARIAGPGSGTTVIGDRFAGKYNYASPEQVGLFGGKVDERSDIYSFGLVLAEALGKPLDMSGSPADVILKRQKLPDLSGVDDRLRPLLTRMLQPDPKDRIASMFEVAAWTEDGSLAPGTPLDDLYELEKMIGSGGVGEVYRGRKIETGEPVAIKMIRPELAGDAAIFALFRKEAAALQALRHASIVGYFGFSTDRRLNRPYLAMEYADGPSLSDRLERTPLSLQEADVLRRRLASGLQAAHDTGITHRDVSPDNIILAGGNIASAKLIDFGIARIAGLGAGTTVIGDRFAGKYNYASPEQVGLFGGKVDNRSDIYSFGLVLAEAVLGTPLDMSGSHADVVLKRQKLPDLSGVDDYLRPLLTRMLQPDPKDRIGSMLEVADWAEQGSLPPGSRLSGLYEIGRMIGSGGMGEVYRGRQVKGGVPVAIKMIRPELAGDAAIFALFRKEAAALQALNHDSIVRYFIFAIDRVLDRPYLAMEYADGPSLSDRVRQAPLSSQDADVLRRRIASGLQVAHDKGIVHRDVSSDNIILAGGNIGSAKLIDFGIARTTGLGGYTTLIGNKFAGKYNYASPEQLGLFGGEVTNRSDIYSFGLVLAEALRGKPLDMSGREADAVFKRQSVPDLSGIDSRLRPLLTRMLQPDPEDRIGSMSEVADWVEPKPPPPKPPPPKPPEPLPLPQSRPLPELKPPPAPRPLPEAKPTPAPRAPEPKPAPELKPPPAPRPLPELKPTPAPRPPEPKPAPELKPPPAPRSLPVGLIAAGVVALGVVGASAYFFLGTSTSTPTQVATVAPTAPKPAPTPPPAPPSQIASTTAPPLPAPSSPAPADPALTPAERLARVYRYVRYFDGGPCFYASPVELTERTATIDVFASSDEQIRHFEADFRMVTGIDPHISAAKISPAQCPAMAFLQRLDPDPEGNARLEIRPETARPGQSVAGELQGTGERPITLLTIGDTGGLKMLPSPRRERGKTLFDLRPDDSDKSQSGGRLLIALATARPLVSATKVADKAAAWNALPALLEEATAKQNESPTVLAAVKLVPFEK